MYALAVDVKMRRHPTSHAAGTRAEHGSSLSQSRTWSNGCMISKHWGKLYTSSERTYYWLEVPEP
jgi:hypothetical protein